MGMTALRNRRGIMAGDHTGKVGPGAGGPPDPATLKRISEIARTQGPDAAHAAIGKMAGPQAQQAVQQAGSSMAPRYQKMLADGVDPSVVAKRAAAFSGGQLPGQGQAQPVGRGGGLAPNSRPDGDLQAATGPNGSPMTQPGYGTSLPGGGGTLSSAPGQMPTRTPPSGGGGWQDPGAVGSASGLATASPMQSPPNLASGGMAMGGPTPRGQFPINPAQGGALSPNAWGALGGGSPQSAATAGYLAQMNGMPSQTGAGGAASPELLAAMNAARGAGAGAAGGPSYGNDAQARPTGGAAGLQSMNGGGLQAAPGAQSPGAPSPDMRSLNGGGFQSGPPGQTPPIASVPGASDPDQMRQQSVARALAGRMAGGGGAFNQ